MSLSEPNRRRLVAYLQRAAIVHAADPLDWLRRIKEGEAVKARLRRIAVLRKPANVVALADRRRKPCAC